MGIAVLFQKHYDTVGPLHFMVIIININQCLLKTFFVIFL